MRVCLLWNCAGWIDDTRRQYSPWLINVSHFVEIAQGPRTYFVSRFCTSQPRSFRSSFRPRFHISRNSRRFQVEEKDIRAFRLAPSTEIRGGACCGSHFGWAAIFAFCCQVYKHNLRHWWERERCRVRDASVYFLLTKDSETIQGNIRSKDRGSWYHTRQYISKHIGFWNHTRQHNFKKAWIPQSVNAFAKNTGCWNHTRQQTLSR